MSYADAAKKGPKQSPEDTLIDVDISSSRAPAPPSIAKDESASSLIDVDSPKVQSVQSDFEDAAVKTRTQAERIDAEASNEASKVRNQAKGISADVKEKAGIKDKNRKQKAKEEWASFKANAGNPVVAGNLLVWTVGIAAIGFGGYKKYSEGKLDWKLAGVTAGAVGAFAAADYYGSQWLFQNKYPTK